MQSQALEFSSSQDMLQNYVTGFWARDVWDMTQCPLAIPDQPSSMTIDFTSLSPSIGMEVKCACRWKLESGRWSLQSTALSSQLRDVFRFLSATASMVSSLLDQPLEYWESSMRSYLTKQGRRQGIVVTRPDANQELRSYKGIDPLISVLRQIYLTLAEIMDLRPEFDKDTWDVLKLGAKPNKARSGNKLNFVPIQQVWLRHAAKQFMRYCLTIQSVASCQSKLTAITVFSQFLSKEHPSIQPPDVNRLVMLEYLSYLVSTHRKESSRSVYLIHLRSFLELSSKEGWLEIPSEQLIDTRDIPQIRDWHPRFIPQDVLIQLNQHLELLAPAFMQMVLIIQECGMRVTELLNLQFNCIVQDAQGDWFLRYYQGKMKKEHSIPISREVTAIIQEQQQTVREAGQEVADLLFPDAKGNPYKYGTFLHALNRLAYEQNIRDSTGQPWHFELHQFRHTVGTRMINNGVPQPIIQRYLGHASPEMTNRYAFIQDQTMKEEFAKYRSKIVNIAGKVIEEDPVVDVADLQWMKKSILAQAVPNGYCGLPVVAGPCPHANACLTCTHFRTDINFLPKLKDQLVATEKILEVAETNNWQRQVEMNRQVKNNLERVIIALEANDQ